MKRIKRALICRWLHRWHWNAHMIGYVSPTSRRIASWSRRTCSSCRDEDWPTPPTPHEHKWSKPEWTGSFIGRQHCTVPDCTETRG